MLQETQEQYALACTEVGGGNRQVTRTVELPDLKAWIYSNPLAIDGRGGDVHYLSVCGEQVLSRIALADVSGHGSEVSAPAEVLHALMRDHINTWDQTDFVRTLNQAFRGSASNGKYATAVVLGFLRDTGGLLFTNAGHLPPLWYRSTLRTWSWLNDEACEANYEVEGLPVGLIPGTGYRQTLVFLEPSDILILYTDGITEVEDASGEMLGRDGLRQWLQQAPTDSPEALGDFLLSRLGEFRNQNSIDDETIIAIQRGNPLWLQKNNG